MNSPNTLWTGTTRPVTDQPAASVPEAGSYLIAPGTPVAVVLVAPADQDQPADPATPEGVLSYAIGYAERRATGGQIAAADVLAGLAEIGWTVTRLTSDPFAGKALAPDACPTCGHVSLWHEANGTGPCTYHHGRSFACDCPGPPTTGTLPDCPAGCGHPADAHRMNIGGCGACGCGWSP